MVALGDSITEGANSTSNTNRRWPDFLAARLNAVGNRVGVRGVVNAGISGNAVTKDFNCCGGNPSGLSRLDRDVLSHDGVSTVIVALGINDIGNYPNETVNVADITDGLRQIADRLHRADKTVLVATLTPFAVTTLPGYYSLEKDAKRMAVNQFIRSAPYWDGIVDFERALAARRPGDGARRPAQPPCPARGRRRPARAARGRRRARLRRHPDEQLLRRVLVRGYFEPAASHEHAARELHLSRAAYFRRLRSASERVAAWLAMESSSTA